MDKKAQIHLWYVIAAVLLMLFIQSIYLESTKATPIPYSRFETLLNDDKVKEVAITQNQTQSGHSAQSAFAQIVRDDTTRKKPTMSASAAWRLGIAAKGLANALSAPVEWLTPSTKPYDANIHGGAVGMTM